MLKSRYTDLVKLIWELFNSSKFNTNIKAASWMLKVMEISIFPHIQLIIL